MNKSRVVYALQLALLSILIMVVQTEFEITKIGTVGVGINALLWLIKFIGSIWLLYYFIKESSKESEQFTYKDGVKSGMAITLISSLLCSLYQAFSLFIIHPTAFEDQLSEAMELMEQSNPDVVANIEAIIPNLPSITIFVSFFFYWILGIIASSIIANYTKRERSLFDQMEEQQ
ncbi:MAG: DUF4199 domain-containing protein [Bacteroidales bacterium]